MKLRALVLVLIFFTFLFLSSNLVFADTPIVNNFIADPVNPQVGQQVNFLVDAYDPIGNPLTIKWQHHFSHSEPYDQEGASNIFSWTYTQAGTYVPVAEVYDSITGDGPAYGWTTLQVTEPPANNPPVADSGGPYVLYVNQAEASFWAGGSYDPDPGDSIISYEWDMDNNGTFYGSSSPAWWESWWFLTVAYDMLYPADPVTGLPTNTIALRVTDSHGAQSIQTTTVTIYDPEGDNYPPIAEASAYWDSTGNPVTLDASLSRSSATITNYEWDLDFDGTYEYSSALPTVVKTWYSPGTFFVRLRITDSLGRTATDVGDVNIDGTALNNPPTAHAGGPYTGNEGQAIVLDGTSSVDPDPGDTLTYEWDINGDATTDYTGANPSVTFDDNGDYTVSLKVTDTQGATDTDTATVTVANVSPVINSLSVSKNPAYVNEELTFNVSATDVSADIATLYYYWDFNWDHTFEGDPSGIGLTTINHTYTQPSADPEWDYVVVVKVVDKDGGYTYGYKWPVVIENPPNNAPTAEAGGPYSGNEGQAITLDGSASSDSDTGDSIVSYEWDINGDGTTDYTGANPSVTFDDNGDYTVSLKVTDTQGATDTDTATVTVANVSPTVNSITITPNPTTVGQTTSFQADVSDPGADTFTYDWDFDWTVHGGNGKEITGTTDNPVTWTYSQTYTNPIYATVWVTDDDGGSSMKFVSVTVNEAEPPNNINNGSFEIDEDSDNMPDSWQGHLLDITDGKSEDCAKEGKFSFKIKGDKKKKKYAWQHLTLAGNAGDDFVFSCYNKTVAEKKCAKAVAVVILNNADGTKSRFRLIFNKANRADWKMMTKKIIASKNFVSSDVYLRFNKQNGISYFDEVKLYKSAD
ncbi:MAG: PKD domain-containing protein [Actinobacteria bacterium]|nr:MAG: PKD domain-containing protein [Actinomycetota bacterium]